MEQFIGAERLASFTGMHNGISKRPDRVVFLNKLVRERRGAECVCRRRQVHSVQRSQREEVDVLWLGRKFVLGVQEQRIRADRSDAGLQCHLIGLLNDGANALQLGLAGLDIAFVGSCPTEWCRSSCVSAGLSSSVRLPGEAGRRLDHRSLARWFPGPCSERAGPPTRRSAPAAGRRSVW